MYDVDVYPLLLFLLLLSPYYPVTAARGVPTLAWPRRNKVATAKQSMDLNHLQLENLLYERNHLARETQLCKDFT